MMGSPPMKRLYGRARAVIVPALCTALGVASPDGWGWGGWGLWQTRRFVSCDEAGAGNEGVCGLTGGVCFSGLLAPRRSRDEARDAPERETQDFLGGAGRGQVHPDHRLHLDDAGGDLDEAQAQGVELGGPPH